MTSLPPRLATTLAHAGGDAAAWGAALPGLTSTLADHWQLTLGAPFEGGSWSLVLPATRADGAEVVLKLVLPSPQADHELAVLSQAGGRGLVHLIAADRARHAMLLERLEPAPTDDLALTPKLVAQALTEFWQATSPLVTAPQPDEHKARTLQRSIDDLRGCSLPQHAPALALAEQFATLRLAATNPSSTSQLVLCHGDPHPGNLMMRADHTPVLIDADGFSCEPEYDLGVILRGWTTQVLSSDHPVDLLRTASAQLAHATATDSEAIWQWAYLERVTSGLSLRQHGHDAEGLTYLDSALRLLQCSL